MAVAAVLAVALAAALDAFDREREAAPRVPSDVRGELVWSDEDCRRHALRLPDLARRDYLTVGCGVFTRTDNLGVKDGAVAWFAYPEPGGTTTLLSRRDLAEQAGDAARVRSVVWLRGRRFAAIVDKPGPVLTLWEGSDLRRALEAGVGFTELRASPSARYFAAVDPDRSTLAVFDRDGRRVDVTGGRAIAWSPDERYAAVAGDGHVVVVPAGGGAPVARIPVAARDLDWRAEGR